MDSFEKRLEKLESKAVAAEGFLHNYGALTDEMQERIDSDAVSEEEKDAIWEQTKVQYPLPKGFKYIDFADYSDEYREQIFKGEKPARPLCRTVGENGVPSPKGDVIGWVFPPRP